MLFHIERRERWVTDSWPAGASMGAFWQNAASTLIAGGLQCCCVWPMCVSEDKTHGSSAP